MYQFAAAQQTSIAKLPTFFERYQTEMCPLSVNETKITYKNAFN